MPLIKYLKNTVDIYGYHHAGDVAVVNAVWFKQLVEMQAAELVEPAAEKQKIPAGRRQPARKPRKSKQNA